MRNYVLPATVAVFGGTVAAQPAGPGASQETIDLDFKGGNGAPNVAHSEGDLDGRVPLTDGVVFFAASNDTVVFGLDGAARPLTGKTVKFNAIPKYKSERKEGCKKVIEYQELPTPFSFPKKLTVGAQLRVLVRQERPNGELIRECEVVFGTPAAFRVKEPSHFRVRLKFNAADVCFAKRPALTQAEWDEYVEPVKRDALSRSNVTDFRVDGTEVLPGDVAALKLKVTATRGAP